MKIWADNIKLNKNRLAIPIMTHPGIEIIGKKVVDAVKDGEIHAAAIVALNEKYTSAAATVIMDLTVEAEAFGAKLIFPDDEVPSVIDRLIQTMEDVENLQIPNLDTARIPQYIKANKIAAETIKDRPVLSGCIGPFSLAGRLYDMTEMMMAIYVEPELAVLLLDKCTQFIIKYVQALKETGVNGIVVAEPAAGLLSNDDATNYSTIFVKKIVDAVQDDNFIVILHNCGNTGHCTASMIQSGALGLHFGNKINMIDVLNEVPGDILVMGNLDPVSVLKQGVATSVAQATTTLLNNTTQYQNFILSSGCDTPPGMPLENIEAFYEALSQYNKVQ